MRVGSYDLLSEIGRGAMGTVHVAHTPDGSEVALKIFARKDAAAFMRFEHDRPLLGTLGEAEGFVPLLDAGGSTSGPFTVMPLVQGDNLRARLARGPMGVHETLALARALATALGHAHIRGIVHGGIKPENVLFTEKDTPLLADAGLAKHFDQGVVGNWLVYRAPEQTEGGYPGGPRADVFSLGAMLQECLAGPEAFAAAGAAGQRPELLGPWAMEAPWSLLAAIERALARDPRVRFADGFAMLEALEVEASSAPLTPPSGQNVPVVMEPVAVEQAAPLVVRVNEVAGPVARPVLVLRPPRVQALASRFGRRTVFAVGFSLALAGGFAGVLGMRKLALERRVRVLEELDRRGAFPELEVAARAVALDYPAEPRAQRFLTHAYMAQDRFREALQAARRTAELPDADPEDTLECGVAWLRVGDAAAAKQYLEAAVGQPGISRVLEARASAGLACVEAVLFPDTGHARALGALARAPEDSVTLALAGKAYLGTGDAAEAAAVLERAALARLHDDSVLVDRACALAAAGASGDALALLEQILEARPDDVPARLARARIELRFADYTAAADDADRVRALDISCEEAHLIAALALAWQGKLDDAEQRTSSLAQFTPGSLDTAIAEAQLSLARGKAEESFVHLRDAPAPTDRRHGLLLLALRSIALQAALRLPEARSEADLLAKLGSAGGARWLAPGDDGLLAGAFVRRYGLGGPESAGHELAAEALLYLGKHADADQELMTAIGAHPIAPRSSYALGMLQLDATPPNTKAALVSAERAIRDVPELAEMRALRAEALRKTGDLAHALREVERAVELDPRNFRHHLLRAHIRLEMHDVPGALAKLDDADRLAPRTQVEICVLRARLLIDMDRRPEALKVALKGLVVAPGDPDLLRLKEAASSVTLELETPPGLSGK
jgi:tetratricopeptide (TPR) repeat protein